MDRLLTFITYYDEYIFYILWSIFQNDRQYDGLVSFNSYPQDSQFAFA